FGLRPSSSRVLVLPELIQRSSKFLQQPGIVRRISKRELVVTAGEVIPAHCRVALGDAFVSVRSFGLLPLQRLEGFESQSDIAQRELPARLPEQTTAGFRLDVAFAHGPNFKLMA